MIRQEDCKDCGAACLAMIIQYYHGNIPYEQLKDQLHVDKTGVKASEIIEVAKKIGFEAKGMEGNFQEFIEETILLPCIAHVAPNESYYHYIVLFEINQKKQYIIIGDPARGIQKLSFQQFEQIWNHIILTFYPKAPITYIETTPFLKTYFMKTLKKETSPITIMVLLSLIITVFSIFNSTLLQHFISMLEQHDELMYLYFSMFLYAGFILIKNGSSFLRNKLFFHIYQRIDFQFMKLVFHQILHLPYRHYKNRTTGEMIARIQDISVIRSFLATVILSSLMDLPLFFISGSLLYGIHEKLFFIAFITLIMYIMIFCIYQKQIQKKVEQLEEESAKVTSYMVESISGYESVFGSHLKEIVEQTFEQKYTKYIKGVKKLEYTQNESQILNQSLFDFSILFILGLGIWFISKNQLSMASLLLFHSLFIYFIDPVRNLLRLGEEWKKVNVAWKRLSNLFYEQQELGIYEQTIHGSIEFKNATFSYFENQPILKNITFHIKKGNKVLLIGKSGHGKSTILKLLMKYYEPNRNSIFIDGIDLVDIKKEAIEQNIVYVSMREQLFTGSISHNILLGKKANHQYQQILKMTEVDEMIEKNPLGHHLMLEENGSNLSGGEKQRVVLARTLLLPFNILLLDEATSQMDENMERRILKRLFEKFPNKTMIMISHRMENADLFDQCIEISNGKIKKDVRKNG